jgi:hypothetical protein
VLTGAGKCPHDGRVEYMVGAAGEYLWAEAHQPAQHIDPALLLFVGGSGGHF